MLALRIAFRYLFSKKSTNAINVISAVSMIGMAVGAFALIVVLSVFNGFEGLVLSLYNSFYPDIEISAVKGKTFNDDATLRGKILKLTDVVALSRTLEESAYIKYGQASQLATIKGVDEQYTDVTLVQHYVRDGKFILSQNSTPCAVVGANMGYPMNINVDHPLEPLTITVPKKGVKTTFLPEDNFSTLDAIPTGIFSIQQEFDSKYVFIGLSYAQDLLDDADQVSSYEIRMKNGVDLNKARASIQKLVGNNFLVRTRYEQKAETYRVMLIERWVTTAILGFIILIISFNIIGSLSMLVLEKSKDISILKAMGGNNGLVLKVYLLNGMLAALIGAAAGLALGYGFCLLQIKYHFLKLSGGGDSSFIIDYYPIVLKLRDPIVTVIIVVSISLLASYFPARRAGQSQMHFS